MGLKIISSAAVLPAKRIFSLAKETTGIEELRYALDNQSTSDLVVEAVRACDTNIEKINALLVGTTSPDSPSPATAHRVAAKLNMQPSTFCADVGSSCTSFLSAAIASQGFLKQKKTVCVAAGELKHWQIPESNMRLKNLFSDGASAIIFENSSNDQNSVELAYTKIRTDLVENIKVEVNLELGRPELIMTEPRRMYREILREMHDAVLSLWESRTQKLQSLGLNSNLVPGFIFAHQANEKLLLDLRARLPEHIAMRMPVLMSDIGNTVSASLPILRTRSLILLAQKLNLPISNKVYENRCVLSAEWRGEKIAVADFFESACASWIEKVPQHQHQFFENYARHFGDLLLPECDIWLSAGGGFQTLGCLHTSV